MGKTYACSDLHGYYTIYEQIKNYIQPEDKVYFLGDAGDRGPDSWKTIKAVLADPQFIYLKGNHEDMLLKAFYDMEEGNEESKDSYQLLVYNGGQDTIEEALSDPDCRKIMRKLCRLPLTATYINKKGQIIHMSHAGHDLDSDDYDYLWDRLHFYSPWDYENHPNDYVIHGHTPVSAIREDRWNIDGVTHIGRTFRYNKGHKIDIDNGVFFTEVMSLLDLDTFKEIPFSALNND